MNDEKKSNPPSPPKPQPVRELNESIAPCTRVINDSAVTNTMPAPPNPNRGGNSDKD